MRTFIPLIALSLSALLLVGCPDDETTGGGGSGTGATGGEGTGGSGGEGTGATGGEGTGGSGGEGTGATGGDACGAGTECDSDDGDSGVWCSENVCGSSDDLLYAFCNDDPDNSNADGEFACGCFAGACSRTEENNCFAPTDCTPGPDADSFCISVCESECGGPTEWRDGLCQPTGPDTAFCECLCADGTGTCFE